MMNRKHFLNAAATGIAGCLVPFQQAVAAFNPPAKILIPPYLKSGDVIGITAPAGFIKGEGIAPAVQVLEQWGFKVKIGATIGKHAYTFGGTDAERIADFQSLLDDKNIAAILCARGGYGIVRIIDNLDFTVFKKQPKWIAGFSDATVLHSHIQAQCGVASLHCKMTNSFPDVWENADPVQVQTIESIREALTGKKMTYTAFPNVKNKTGIGKGALVGGNLKLLESLAGTPSDINTKGKILFVEDTGEYLYSIDRMFWNLKRSGKLNGLNGLIIGGFKIKPDDEGEAFGLTLEQIVLEKIKDYNYPVCFDFPVGHQRANYALKCGVPHQLSVQTGTVTLTDNL